MEYLLPIGAIVSARQYAPAGAGGGNSPGPGRARAFASGDTDYLSASHTIGAETTFSMAAWIKISSAAGLARTIMGLFSSDLNDDGYFEMQLTTGGVLRGITEQDNGLGTSNDFGTTDLRDGAWHLVVCARNGSTLTLWVDNGTDTPVSETRVFPTIDTAAIGCRVDSVPSAPFEGDIDECSLWEGALLTDANVAAMYALGIDSTKRYLSSFTAQSIPTPTHHWSLSIAQNPLSVGKDEIGSVDLTDNGTTDTEGIPAGD